MKREDVDDRGRVDIESVVSTFLLTNFEREKTEMSLERSCLTHGGDERIPEGHQQNDFFKQEMKWEKSLALMLLFDTPNIRTAYLAVLLCAPGYTMGKELSGLFKSQ